MTHAFIARVDLWPWYAVGLYWAVTAVDTKSTQVIDTIPSRLVSSGIVGVAAALLFSDALRVGVLAKRMLPINPWLDAVGLALTCFGAAIAIVARTHLGRNWSARVTVKVDHVLIRSGPYRFIRHPIYTGLLIAVAGTATVIGEWRGLLALGLGILGFTLKARREEAMMVSAFGDEYREYRRRAGFLGPRIERRGAPTT
jgi:protein-S-isoprenylcysteine O-methyltransferase Ste14